LKYKISFIFLLNGEIKKKLIEKND
jgi:hypothetical protein